MGTGSSSKTNDEDDVRDRLNSGEFQKISPPSSPSIQTKIDEMSYSGILVEKPDTPSATSAAVGASFAADLTTPPVSNRSKGRSKKDRRIVKATPPPASSQHVASSDSNRNDNDVDSPAVHHHSESLASPIGANAVTEMLEESIEKNASKNKLMERVSNKQKSDREKLLQEKRRRQQPSGDKPKAEVNPFSRFLKAFSIDANPTHKRKESMDAADPNKRLKFGFDDSNTKKSNSETPASDDEAEETEETMPFSWIAAASVATIAVLVIAIVRSKKK